MTDRTSETHFIGPMGSEFWQIRVPPKIVPIMADRFDWNKLGRRVVIDPIAGIISWINPSGPHVGLAEATVDIVKEASQFLNGQVRGMRDMRWRLPDDPKNTGVEADASFYIAANAERWYTAMAQGWETVADFETRTPPDLVVEVEITHLDENKPTRYAELGVQEMWQTTRHQNQDQRQGEDRYKIEVVVLDLQARGGPREVVQSRILPGLTAASLPQAYKLALNGRSKELQNLLGKELVAPS